MKKRPIAATTFDLGLKKRAVIIYENYGDTESVFLEKLGLPEDFFTSKASFTPRHIQKLETFYPEINWVWFYTGKGKFINEATRLEMLEDTLTYDIREFLADLHRFKAVMEDLKVLIKGDPDKRMADLLPSISDAPFWKSEKDKE